MSPSDGKGVSKEAKKSAPHFGANWQAVLNAAIVKGKGSVEDTEAEMRAQIAERAKTKGGAASSSLVDDPHEVGQVYDVEDDGTELEYGENTRAWAADLGLKWRPLA